MGCKGLHDIYQKKSREFNFAENEKNITKTIKVKQVAGIKGRTREKNSCGQKMSAKCKILRDVLFLRLFLTTTISDIKAVLLCLFISSP